MVKVPERNDAALFYGTQEKVEAKPPLTARRAPAETRASTESKATEPESAVAELFFGSDETLVSSYGPSLADAVDRLTDITGMSAADRESHITAAARLFDEARIGPSEASRLHSLAVEHIAKPADDATVAEWESESRQKLRDKFGLDEGQQRIKIVKEFIANRPGLKKLLAESGLGSHPDIVLALAERSEELRMKPREASAKERSK